MFTKEELSPHALELFRRVKAALPIKIAERLRSNRHFVTHGSYRTYFLFDIWDCHQSDILPHKHFKYGLGYDRRPGAIREGAVSLWLNCIRIYRDRDAIVSTLRRELPRVVPDGFTWKPSDRAFEMIFQFDYPRNLAALPDMLLPRFVSLISAVHPIIMPIIDQFTTPLAPGERRAVVAQRGRISFSLPGVHDRERVREYTRSIPPSWRPIILARSGYRCANAKCRADLRTVPYHIDHIVPFSKGGTTTLANLQALCGPCNLAKGNRD